LNSIEQRLADPRFDEFRRRRMSELIDAGMAITTAINFAERECRGRARVSFEVGIQKALEAKLVVNFLGVALDDEQLDFRLLVAP
jgi:hypothetical protein